MLTGSDASIGGFLRTVTGSTVVIEGWLGILNGWAVFVLGCIRRSSCRRRFAGPARNCRSAVQPEAQRRQQLFGVHRLGEIVARSRLETFLPVALHGLR